MADMICENIRDLVYARNEILSENKSLEHEIDSLKSCEIPAIHREIEELSCERSAIKKELKQLAEETCKYEKESRRMEEMYNQRQAEVQNFIQENACLQSQCKSLEESADQYQEDIVSLGKYLAGLKKTADEKNRTAEDMMRENKESECKVNQLKSKVCQMKKCLKELSEELEDKCNELDCVFQRLKNSENVRDQLECKGTEIRRQVLDLQTSLCQLQSKITTEQSNHEKLTTKVKDGKTTRQCLGQTMDKCMQEIKKVQQRKECHLKDILNVINEVKNNTTLLRPKSERQVNHIKTHGKKNNYRNIRKSESQSNVYKSERNSKESLNRRLEAFDPAGDVEVSRMVQALAGSKSSFSELGSGSPDRFDVTKHNTSSLNRQRTMCMLDQFMNKSQEYRKSTNFDVFDGPKSNIDKINNMDPKDKTDRDFLRPKSILESKRNIGEFEQRPRTIDITIRSAGEGLSKNNKKYGSSRPKIIISKDQNISQDQRNGSTRRTQKIVDKILKELLNSDVEETESFSQDINALKQAKCRCKN